MALTFDTEFDPHPGRVEQVDHGVRRVLAPNASPFTFHGTGTYIVGEGTVAVIDPGPADEAHINALVTALQDETVSHIVCTHTHADHSPGSRMLRDRVGGVIVGCAPHPAGDTMEQLVERAGGEGERAEATKLEEHFDPDHVAEWEMFEGDRIAGPGWTLEAVQTPGHIANHLCFAFPEQSILFSGDHVMAWSTSVVSPPGGNLNDYLASLRKVAARAETKYWPTHGAPVRAPHAYVTELIAHRESRSRQIVAGLSTGPKRIPELVTAMYPGLNEKLIKAAGRSVLSHLHALREDHQVQASDDKDSLDTVWQLR
jgi:glyoxylase-like metal-dependent hydrolase (beta-lactamase superfamily II)